MPLPPPPRMALGAGSPSAATHRPGQRTAPAQPDTEPPTAVQRACQSHHPLSIASAVESITSPLLPRTLTSYKRFPVKHVDQPVASTYAKKLMNEERMRRRSLRRSDTAPGTGARE